MTKTTKFLLAALTLLAVSCKKGDDKDSAAGGTMKLLTTDNWKVAGGHSITYAHGNTGAAFTTYALARQSATELRWNVGIRGVGNSFQKPTDIILSTSGSTAIRDLTNEPPFPTPLLAKAQGAEWKLVERDAPQIFEVLRNNQPTSPSQQDPNDKDNVNAADDGFFVTGTDYSTYEFSFFNFATQSWKRSLVSAERAAALRYAGTTYVVGFNLQYDPFNPQLRVWKDTGNAMQLVKAIAIPKAPLLVMNAAVFGKYALVTAGDNNAGDGYYKVYKIDLDAFTVQVVQMQPMVQPYSYSLRFAENTVLSVETDDTGNLYAVEKRTVSQQARYSIRKYNASGGNDLVLKEADLKEGSIIEALRWFNGKLHAAVSYREQSDGTSTWHLQLIQLK